MFAYDHCFWSMDESVKEKYAGNHISCGLAVSKWKDLTQMQPLLQGSGHMAQSAVPSVTGCCQKEKGTLQSFQFLFSKDDSSSGHCHPFAVQSMEKPSTVMLYSYLQLYFKYCSYFIILNASNPFISFQQHCYM